MMIANIAHDDAFLLRNFHFNLSVLNDQLLVRPDTGSPLWTVIEGEIGIHHVVFSGEALDKY